MSRPEKTPNSQLLARIKQLKDFPPRDPEATARGRARFLAEANSIRQAVSETPFRRHSLTKRSIEFLRRRKEKITMIPYLTSLVIALTLMIGGAGATAYASQDALPGDFLFPVKTVLEDAQLTLTQDEIGTLQLQARFTQLRMDEISALLASGQYDVIPEAVAQFENRLQEFANSMQAAVQHDPERAEAIAAQMEQALAQHTQVLSEALSSAPQQAQPALERALQVSKHEHQVLQERFMQPPEGIPAGMPAGTPPTEYPGSEMMTKTPGMPGGMMTATPMPGIHEGTEGGMNMTPSHTPVSGMNPGNGMITNTPAPTQNNNSGNNGGEMKTPTPGGGGMETQPPGDGGGSGNHDGGNNSGGGMGHP